MLRAFFDRIDTDHSGELIPAEVSAHLEKIGVGQGFFGGAVRAKAVDQIFTDLGRKEAGTIDWPSFINGAGLLLPPGLQDTSPAAVASVFGAIAGKRSAATEKQIASYIAAHFKGDFAPIVADVGAKVAVDLLDRKGDHKVRKKDLLALAKDLERERAKL